MGGGISLPALAIKPPAPQATPFELAGQAMSLRDLSQRGQLQGQALQEGQLKIDQTKALNDAYAGALSTDANGQPVFDRNKVLGTLAARGQGSLTPQVQKTFNALDESFQKVQELKDKHTAAAADVIGTAAKHVIDSNYNPEVLGTMLAYVGSHGYQQEADQLRQQVSQHPEMTKQIVDSLYSSSPKATEAGKNIQTAAGDAADQARKAALAPSELAQSQYKAANPPVTEPELYLKAAGGDPMKAVNLQTQQKIASRPVNNIMTRTDATDIADAIENGDQPPTLQGLYRNAGPVRAELARRGFPLAKAETDWKATQKYLGTLNGSQQTRIRQAISNASDSLDKIEGLYADVQRLGPMSGFKVLNHAAIVAMKNLPGEAGAKATALDAQIADITSELGNVYMGGNSPTDHSLSLAQKNLSSDWNAQTFSEALKQTRLNLGIRKSSINNGAPAGVGSEYFQGGGGTPPPAQQVAPATTDPFAAFGGKAR